MTGYRIDWIDSTSSNSTWTLLSELDGELRPIEISTYGVIVKKTKEFIIVAQNYGIDPDQVCNLMTIPRGCIKKITRLEGKKI